jgi:spore coat polysaccharide biosynthesis predicted glycosyltransferase SpsG/RimJ/RimL family protein N-acetyltransferase
VVIDDLTAREHEADLLIDPNLGAEGPKCSTKGGCRLLRGTAYAPLSLDYLKPRETELSERRTPRIVVSLGGGSSELIVALAAQLCDHPRLASFVLEFIIPSDRDRVAVEQCVGDRPDTVVHGRVASLRRLLESATLAIGAGGTSAWERLRLGVPAVVVALAQNQERTCRALSEHGVARWVEDSEDLAAIVESAVHAIEDVTLQARARRIGPLLVDGRGADRIAMALAGPVGPITLREVREQDAAAIFAMANDPDTRAGSRETSTIRPDEHLEWFEHRREVDRGTFWIAEDGDLVVGQVRFSRISDAWEVSFALEAAARGFGLSEGMLSEGIRRLWAELRDSGGPNTVVGVVHESTEASRRVFDKLGFRQDLTAAEARSLGAKVGRGFTAYVLTVEEPVT